MKLSEYRQNLLQNDEYVNAKRNLKLKFDLANSVLKARLNKGLTQTELAKAIGTKQANISRIEAGLGNPTISIIQKLSIFLDMEVTISPEKPKESLYSFSCMFSTKTKASSSDGILVSDWPKPKNMLEFNTNSLTSKDKEEVLHG